MMLYYTNTRSEIEIPKYFEVHSSSVARPTKTYKAAYYHDLAAHTAS